MNLPSRGFGRTSLVLQAAWILLFISTALCTPSFAADPYKPGLLGKAGVVFSYCAEGFTRLLGRPKLPYRFRQEFSENPTLPGTIREAVITALGTTEEQFSGYQPILQRAVTKVLDETGSKTIIEMGSGSGMGTVTMADGIRPSPENKYKLVTTDLFPQVTSWKKNFKDRPGVSYVETPVSFTEFPTQLKGVPLKGSTIVVVSAMHHANNRDARIFLENAAREGTNVVIMEPLERDLKSAITAAGATLPSFLAPVLARDLSLRKRAQLAFWTWVVPAVPAIFLHDGVLSTLRQRTESDWKELTKGLPFTMRYETKLGPMGNFTVLTLIPTVGPAPKPLTKPGPP